VGACQRHHILWKPQNTRLYNSIVNRHVGATVAAWLDRVEEDSRKYVYTMNDWLKVEADLNSNFTF
jgi:hypothetical protein